ncbi:hypothetical protein C2U72_09590 [Prosthecomicrobium hirschii]|uniref:S8 family peptidase n=1 Tax=Prosthecodimorpha hirschii TaxID=665126 RepID=UPI00112AD507|nr:S8 family peptidase [Prosthecomicrobium hirschii]TPQ51188.1 hypothetical protein C2U72_09590 [Prosthecomicrobium hirschii]
MPRYDHLILERLPERFERRKRPGFGQAPQRDERTHADRINRELDTAIEVQRLRRRPTAIRPELILRVSMLGQRFEDDWEALGLTVLSSDADRSLVLFSSNEELRDFRERIAAYSGGAREGRRAAPHNAFLSSIEGIRTVEPVDRIGPRLRDAGITRPEDFGEKQSYVLDVELWDIGHRDVRQERVLALGRGVEAEGGESLDTFVGPSITLARIRASGRVMRSLLAVEVVSSIDLAPEPDSEMGALLDIELSELPPIEDPADGLPVIGIIDSGVNAHPLLDPVMIGAVGVPVGRDIADIWGHGTKVAGVAAYGDLRAQFASGVFRPGARICAAKVLNDTGNFDDTRLVPKLMDEAIRTLHGTYGCRLFVLALADRKSPYDGGKVGSWAATLDALARELDVLVFVSAGNRKPRQGRQLEEAVTYYPDYLLEANNRLFEPAGAANVLTIGSLAHGEGLDPDLAEDVRVRSIARFNEPSPFTRVGPGLGGAVKPELVDLGGTMVFDPVTRDLKDGKDLPTAGMLTTYHRAFERLFTACSGTSIAAPRVAFRAAQLLQRLPTASSNLLRALLVGAADIPEEARQRLAHLGGNAKIRVCGHGMVDLEQAAYSDDARVVLYAEDRLTLDHFAVYRIPIPREFQTEAGDRTIRVTLAYDPPVRHSRNDYRGVKMNFRLVRGTTTEEIFEHYRRRPESEGPVPDLPKSLQCKLRPGPQERELSTVQTAEALFRSDISRYGDDYYLVIRCAAAWAKDHVADQRFAVVVEISHQATLRLYERVRQRIRFPG